ncbi:MAG: hypothetical protein ACR2OM_12905, partial [Aestuariivirgaceae bacterium]
RFVTVKSIIIVLAILAAVAGILTLTWNLSSHLVRAPAAVPEPVSETVKPDGNTKANTGGDVSAPPEPELDAANKDEAVEPGAYDDSWTGTPAKNNGVSGLRGSQNTDPDFGDERGNN